jgi:amino acid transporter
MKKLAGIVAIVGIGLAVGLTLLAFCLIFAGFAEPFGSGSAEWLNHAGASCFALSRIGWVLALAGGAAFAALAYSGPKQEDVTVITPEKPRAGTKAMKIINPDPAARDLD